MGNVIGTETRQSPLAAEELQRAERTLVLCAASFASFCEHVEHIEPSTVGEVITSAQKMIKLASQLSVSENISLRGAYESRIRAVEKGSLHRFVDLGVEVLTGADALARANTWDEVQVAQILHDRQFHPDVFGLSKIDQLRHYTFHVTKLAGLLTQSILEDSWSEVRAQRLPDIAIFGVKLATVCNELLPHVEVDTAERLP